MSYKTRTSPEEHRLFSSPIDTAVCSDENEDISLLQDPLNPKISPLELTVIAIEAALDQKAHDVCGLDLRKTSDVADYFVVVSGTSDRHVRGITDKILLRMKDVGEKAVSITGYETAQWVILDYVNVVVHIFYEPSRQYYRFDDLWSKASRLKLTPSLEDAARRLRTGMVPM